MLLLIAKNQLFVTNVFDIDSLIVKLKNKCFFSDDHRVKSGQKRHHFNSGALSMEVEVGIVTLDFTRNVLVVFGCLFPANLIKVD